MIDWARASKLRGTDQRGRSQYRAPIPDVAELAGKICRVAYEGDYEPEFLPEYVYSLRKIDARVEELNGWSTKHLMKDAPEFRGYETQVITAKDALIECQREAPGAIDAAFGTGSYQELMTPTFALFTKIQEVYHSLDAEPPTLQE